LRCRSKMVGSTRTLTGQPSVMSKWQMLVWEQWYRTLLNSRR
jgi:hypothetical protein